jgi:hypothetical protein
MDIDIEQLLLLAQLASDSWRSVTAKIDIQLLQAVYDRKIVCSKPDVVVDRMQALMLDRGVPLLGTHVHIEQQDESHLDWDSILGTCY